MTPIEQQWPYANYYERGATPGTAFHSDHAPNPYRKHAPPILQRLWFWKKDRADVQLIRTPDQPLQQYFNEKKELSVNPALVPAHGVFVPGALYRRGWYQAHVPSAGRRDMLMASAPNAPIARRQQASRVVDHGARAPIRGKAPKAR